MDNGYGCRTQGGQLIVMMNANGTIRKIGTQKNTVLFIPFLFVIGLVPLQSLGYVPNGHEILSLMLQQLETPSSVQMNHRLTLYNDRLENGKRVVPESLSLQPPMKYRIDINTPSIQRTMLMQGGQRLVVLDGKATQHVERFDQYPIILTFSSLPTCIRYLADLGVDAGISSLGRFMGKVVWVIGAEYPDHTASRFFVDRQTSLPLGWIIAANHGRPFEIQYLDWQKKAGSWFPMAIKFYQQGILVRSIQTTSIELNARFPEDYFDVQKLRSRLNGNSSKGVAKTFKGLNELDEAIKSFGRLFD